MFVRYLKCCVYIFILTTNLGCGEGALNSPYHNTEREDNILYTSFSERPKHLDPARSYSSNEWVITNQIYEPPLQYHYLKRPYELIPLVASAMPEISFYDQNDQPVSEDDLSKIAYSKYRISILPNVLYQPHPAFAKDNKNQKYLYHALTKDKANKYDTIQDFEVQSTRELKAEDFVYQIKRLADPTLNSPIFGLMSEYIIGMNKFRDTVAQKYKDLPISADNQEFVDFRLIDLDGAKVINDYQYEIIVKGHYPQLLYWLAMPFFAPMPWEAVKFYSQDYLLERNISLDWYPIGTGPYLLTENNPNLRISLEQNPNFHGEKYPVEGSEEDKMQGLLAKQGKSLPFIRKVNFILEKESIPYWNKFLQGYYDQSGISSDSFDQAVQLNPVGNFSLTDELRKKGIKLQTSILPTTFYWGFNMLDDVVGGLGEKQKKLRQAISIAFDMEEFINIFQNGRGQVAHGMLPPGIFGFMEDSFNTVVFESSPTGYQRKSIEQAKKLLAEAGYPDGIDPKTKKTLVLYLDAVVGGGPDTNALYAWIRKQFKKINIDLVVRDTQYNRFQDKMRNGSAQIFSWGWNADYPDPENFLFLLYGPNGKVKFDGENASNYDNPKFNALFEKIKSMRNSPERLTLIEEMLAIAQEDAPWIWGYHPKLYTLSHQWMAPFKSNAMSRNTLKYSAIDVKTRSMLREAWNHPILWPISIILAVLLLLIIPAMLQYWRKTHQKMRLDNGLKK